MPPEEFTNRTWAAHVLDTMGAPSSKNNIDNLTRWMAHENYADSWTGTAGKNNPLNNGLGSGGGEGLGSYKDLESSAQFAAKNLENKHFGYPKIHDALMNDASPEEFSKAVVHSDWAGGHYGVESAGAGKYTAKGRGDDFFAKGPPPPEVTASESERNVEARRAGHPPNAVHHTPNSIPVQHAPSGTITLPEVTIVGEAPKAPAPGVVTLPETVIVGEAPKAPAPGVVTLPETTIVGEAPKAPAPGVVTLPETTIVGEAPKAPAPGVITLPETTIVGDAPAQKPMDPRGVVVDRVAKAPNTPVSLSGDVTDITTDVKTGMTTIDFTDKRGAPRSVSFKDPMGVGPDGEPLRHPLGEMVATMDKNNERGTIKLEIDGKGNTDYAVGNAKDVDTGHSGPGNAKDLVADDPRSPAVDKPRLDAAIKDAVERDTPSPAPAQVPAKAAAGSAWDR